MAKIITPLTANQVKNAKPKDKLYKLSDGGGLALWVYPTGGRSWKLSFVQDGKQQTISLGRYPDFSLAEAREWREEIRRKRAHGENVITPKARADFAFEKVARGIGFRDGRKRVRPNTRSRSYEILNDGFSLNWVGRIFGKLKHPI